MNSLLSVIRELLFKNSCPVCNKKKNKSIEILCENCYNTLKRSSSVKKIGDVYYLWKYEGLFKRLITAYKFRGLKKIADIIYSIIKDKVEFIIEKEEIDLIIPVPVHRKRRNERGFNQVEEIVKRVGDYYNIKRKKSTKAMFKILSEDKRYKNIKDSFYIEENLSLDSLNILIVDDIITTGATLNEIEKEIRRYSDVKKVVFFTFAAGKYNRKINKFK